MHVRSASPFCRPSRFGASKLYDELAARLAGLCALVEPFLSHPTESSFYQSRLRKAGATSPKRPSWQ